MKRREKIEKKRSEAQERQEARNKRTTEQQLELIEQRRGNSTKERKRLEGR